MVQLGFCYNCNGSFCKQLLQGAALGKSDLIMDCMKGSHRFSQGLLQQLCIPSPE